MGMSQLTLAEAETMNPKDFRSVVRKGGWTEMTPTVCQGYSKANLAIVPQEYAFEFFSFCYRNPRPCPVLDVTEPGDPHPRSMAPDADLRTDLPKYHVFRDGELIDEPTDVLKYWRDDLVAFLIGCSWTFTWALRQANISWRDYSAYPTSIPCVPAGRFRGHVIATVRAFRTTADAVRAVQISSRHVFMHGPPIHIGDPRDIGIEKLDKRDPFFPDRPVEAPKPGEITMCWGCGVTPQAAAVESKIPFLIAHCPGHMFITDRLVEELAGI